MNEPTFVCDAMLGKLARWLRAFGYDAVWQADIDDWDLVRQARREHRVLLSSDTGIFRIGIVRDGDVPGLLMPCGLSTREQLQFVSEKLNLTQRPPHCMACGGELKTITKEEARGRVPERSFEWLDEFWDCERCGKVFWPGTHWQKIAAELERFQPG